MTRSLPRIALMLSLVLTAGVSVPADGAEEAYDFQTWQIEVESRGLDSEKVVYPFDTTPEMQAWAEEAAGPAGPLEQTVRLANLQRAFFKEGAFDFSYDDSSTLTAQGAFAARRGNCMSFTSLFIAMSRSLGVPTYLMAVKRDPEVDRDGGLVVVNEHVVAAYGSGPQITAYDFSFRSAAPVVGKTALDDVRASALHHNNLGANALREDRIEQAKEHLGITTVLAPEWPAGWVNLGVVRARDGDADGAFDAYRRALEIEPHNSSALNNLSILYRKLGREDESRVALKAAAEHRASPFTLIAMADSEMERGDLQSAEKHLKKAKRGFPREPEVWEGLARFAARTGDEARERKCRRKAEELRTREAEVKTGLLPLDG